jgi:hypothetical protein
MAARLVLVHSPLVGASAWDLVAADLARDGHELSLPDLTGTVASRPPYHSRQAELIARDACGQPSILIGYSAAGPLLATVGVMIDAMIDQSGVGVGVGVGQAGQVKGYIFVDARLPTPGQSWMETVSPGKAARRRRMADDQGWLPPWSQWWGDEALAELIPDPVARHSFSAGCPRLPLAMFEEIQPPAPRWPDAPGAYLRLSEAYDDEADRAREFGWPVIEHESHHVQLLTEPRLVAESLRELIGRLDA